MKQCMQQQRIKKQKSFSKCSQRMIIQVTFLANGQYSHNIHWIINNALEGVSVVDDIHIIANIYKL